MTPRTTDEIRAEIARWKAVLIEHRRAKRHIDAAYCAILVGALTWALGEAASPATRIKVEG